MSPSKPSKLGRQPNRTQRNGVIAAIGLALVFAGIFVVSALFYNNGRGDGGGGGPAAEGAAPDDIEVLTLRADGGEQGEDMLIQLADEDDPSKLDGEITAERFEPIDERTRRIDAPAAWLFLEDDRTIRITANTGELVIPPGERRPSAGVREGDVLFRLYDADAPVNASGRPDLDGAEPALTATFDRPVSFDLDLAQLSTPGRVLVTTETIEFAASDLFAVVNEARERIEFLEFQRGERLTLLPGSEAGGGGDGASNAAERDAELAGGADAGAEPEGESGAEAVPPKIDRYRVEALDDVTLTRGPLRLESDSMLAWVRLVDNRIAFDGGGGGDEEAGDAADAGGVPERAVANGGGSGISGEVSGDPGGDLSGDLATDEPVVYRWSGRLTVEPLDGEPAELAEDNLTARFIADRSEESDRRVTFSDGASGATGRAAAVEYALDRALITLTDAGGGVELSSPDAGRLAEAGRVEVGLETGVVGVPTGGALFDKLFDGRDDPADSEPSRFLRWSDRARFTFATEGGAMTDRILGAALYGTVRGESDDASLAGTSLDARFDPMSDDPRLTRVDIRAATAEQGDGGAGKGGSIVADALRVDFDPRSSRSDPDPVRVVASGGVLARQFGGGSFRAATLDADLDRDDGDNVRIATVAAEGDVTFDDAAGASGSAGVLMADLVSERARLAGPGARATREGATVSGPVIRLAASPGALEVEGPGNFAQGLEASGDLPAGLVTATWTRGMRYEDGAGVLVARGDVEAVSERFGAQRDRFTADRLEATIASDATGDADAESIDTAEGATLVRARLTGRPGARATAEARRYFERDASGQGPPEPRLAELVFLESSRIDYADDGQRVTTPAAGRMVVVDRRSVREQIDAGAEASELGPGQTLFTWTDRMTIAAGEGEATFLGDVVVNHLDLRTRRPAIAEADRIDATFDLAGGGAGEGGDTGSGVEAGALPGNEGGTLRTLTARGDARLRNDRRELVASLVRYDAAAGRAVASADRGTLVTYLDRDTGTVTRARELLWDLLADRIDVLEPAPTVAPGGGGDPPN